MHTPIFLIIGLCPFALYLLVSPYISLYHHIAFLHQRHVALDQTRQSVAVSVCPTLERPRTRSVKYGDRALSAAAPALWDGLLADIRYPKTLDNMST